MLYEFIVDQENKKFYKVVQADTRDEAEFFLRYKNEYDRVGLNRIIGENALLKSIEKIPTWRKSLQSIREENDEEKFKRYLKLTHDRGFGYIVYEERVGIFPTFDITFMYKKIDKELFNRFYGDGNLSSLQFSGLICRLENHKIIYADEKGDKWEIRITAPDRLVLYHRNTFKVQYKFHFQKVWAQPDYAGIRYIFEKIKAHERYERGKNNVEGL